MHKDMKTAWECAGMFQKMLIAMLGNAWKRVGMRRNAREGAKKVREL